ncbi:uncharacterized protein LOC130442964 [Diorhabda sublineata]|uniref:uncharacterized protein LOC130442964 n=1 Tax=Diorhabda sublineata TaxID=1163346 RepID=UPI0024E0FC2D|nr:uncharacterized protein LOC130442964 [Diorhabda sublineata]
MILVKDSKETLEEDMGKRINHSNVVERSLSRKRRYLTFPSGSSLQVVYCLTLPSVGVGEIFVFGLTAALAWELPSTPDELLMSVGKKPITTTETPTTLPPHHDWEDGAGLSQYPHQRKTNVGSSNYVADDWSYKKDRYPVPVKSYYDPFGLKQNFKFNDYSDSGEIPYNPARKMSPKLSRVNGRTRQSFNHHSNINHDDYIHPIYHQIHRRSRRELYGKLEKLLTALSKDGKACIKKALCEVSQVPKGKGTLFQELMKTIFRIKPHEDYVDEDEYDEATNKSHNCTERYPSCQHSVWSDMF